MMKPDELYFAELMLSACRRMDSSSSFDRSGDWPRDIISEPGVSIYCKRAWYILEKWTRKGWYEYGVTLDLGWLTAKGVAALEEVVKGRSVEIS